MNRSLRNRSPSHRTAEMVIAIVALISAPFAAATSPDASVPLWVDQSGTEFWQASTGSVDPAARWIEAQAAGTGASVWADVPSDDNSATTWIDAEIAQSKTADWADAEGATSDDLVWAEASAAGTGSSVWADVDQGVADESLWADVRGAELWLHLASRCGTMDLPSPDHRAPDEFRVILTSQAVGEGPAIH